MSRKVTRRKFMAGTAAGAAAATFKFPMPAIAQAAPFKLGLLTVNTGPLAQGGIPMDQLTGQPQVEHQRQPIRQLEDQELGSPPDRLNAVTREIVDGPYGDTRAVELLRRAARGNDLDPQVGKAGREGLM